MMVRKTSVFFAFLILIVLLGINVAKAGNYTIIPFTYSWCTSSYPTAYTTVSWSMSEATSIAGNNGFTKNQSAKTLVIDLPANFQFNTASTTATITASGTEVSSVSFVFASTARLTVTLTTANAQVEYNTLTFSNFEIRATAAGAGNFARTGGGFKVDNSTGNPTAAEVFGTLFAGSAFTLTSTTCSHPSTATISQYTINNQILKVAITGTGTNCNGTVTSFTFDTDGGNGTGSNLPTSNITTAKLYFTGTTNTFSSANLFGFFSAPNGVFTITGSQALTKAGTGSETNYFWLVYDVPGDANTGAGSNLLDASLTSYDIGGSTISGASLTTPTPAGSRTIIPATFYYSMNSGNWSSTTTSVWSTASAAGPTCNCAPNGSGVVYIAHAVTLDQDRTADAIEIRNGGSLTGAKILTVNAALNTFGTGYFSLTKEMWIKGNMALSGTGSSSCTKQIEIDGDLDVGVGTTLTASGGNNEEIYISGALTVDGNLIESGNQEVFINGGYNFIDGTGTITCSKVVVGATTADKQTAGVGGNKSINSTANLTVVGGFEMNGAYTVTNNGTVSVSGAIDGTNSSSNWTNAASSYLKYGSTTDMFASSGGLTAMANSNIIEYNANGNQNIAFPTLGQYNNLLLSTGGTKTLAIADIYVSGNFTHNATLDAATSAKKITFNGGSAQIISGTSAPTFYDLSITNSSASGVLLQTNATVSNTLSIAGILDIGTSGKTLTINNAATTAVTRTSGYILSENSANTGIVKWNMASTTGDHLYPFGTAAGNYIPFTLNLTAGTIGNVSVSTYPSAADNTPYPSTVTHVGAASGGNNSANTVNRFWQIDKDGASGTATMTFTYADNEWDVSEPADYEAQRWNVLVGSWDAALAGQTQNTGSNSVTVSGVTTFSPWTLAKKSAPLPVKLISFTAKAVDNKTQLKWETASEENNDYFEVERSATGLNFESIVKVKGNGTTKERSSYTDYDNSPYEGSNYYRLKQTDYDGQFSYSGVIFVSYESKRVVTEKKMDIAVAPNPAIGTNFNLQITIDGEPVKEGALIILRDINGKELISKLIEGHLVRGSELIEEIPPGIYIITASNDDKLVHRKVIIN